MIEVSIIYWIFLDWFNIDNTMYDNLFFHQIDIIILSIISFQIENSSNLYINSKYIFAETFPIIINYKESLLSQHYL